MKSEPQEANNYNDTVRILALFRTDESQTLRILTMNSAFTTKLHCMKHVDNTVHRKGKLSNQNNKRVPCHWMSTLRRPKKMEAFLDRAGNNNLEGRGEKRY